MAKLHFYYSAMNAGKSTTLLQSSYNYHERGMETLLFAPVIDTRFGTGKVSSRIGLEQEAISFSEDFNFYDYVKKKVSENPNIKCVLIDEAQFITQKQVLQICKICDDLNTPVLAYGLRIDFRGEPFEGSKYLMAWADQIIEIKTICHCGKKATMNMRVDEQGNKVREGEQILIGGNDCYVATCRKHFTLGQAGAFILPLKEPEHWETEEPAL
ncbi:MAG: thymidine kinase [Gammaproteobacteria bacterium]|nr:thymidine kinase [Gammaproteobacteria bacterium]